MKSLGIIPARFASSRFPGKPLADLQGKPLIQWVWENASRRIENLIVATDHREILLAVKKFGGRAMLTSREHRSGTDRCSEVINTLSAAGESYDVVLNIQGDEPFLDPEDLHLLVNMFRDPDNQIATLASPIRKQEDLFDPNVVKVVRDAGGTALYFSRSPIPHQRDIPETGWTSAFPYLKHIGIYAYLPDALGRIGKLGQSPLEKAESLEQLRWMENGFRIRIATTQQETTGIDTPEDLELARQKIK